MFIGQVQMLILNAQLLRKDIKKNYFMTKFHALNIVLFCLICPKLSECCAMFGKGLHNFPHLSDEIVSLWTQQRSITRLREDLGWAQRRSAGENLGSIQSMEKLSASVIVTSSSS